MNECLFCKLTNWLLSLDWSFLLPYFLVLLFSCFLSFCFGLLIFEMDYDEIYDRWRKEEEYRRKLESEMGL